MDVEALAVAKIQELLARCSHLKPIIASNDKTPFTDGHVDVYSDAGGKKKDWRGRVTVQVKGRTRSAGRPAQISFGIERTDLVGYQRDSGVLYFYVVVDKKGHCTPYYAILSPFTIAYYLNTSPSSRRTVSIQFKRFPHSPVEIERIVALALKTKEQRPSLGFDPDLFQRMKSLTVHSTGELDLTAPLRLTPGLLDYALEITTEGGLTLQLGGELQIYPHTYTERPTEISVAAGESTYASVSTRRVDAETVEVHLGAAITLTMQETTSQRVLNVAYSAPGNFEERLKATRFLVGLIDKQEIRINGVSSALGNEASKFDSNLDDLRDDLESLEELEELFLHLGIDGALVDLDDVEAKSFRWLKALHRAFVQGEELRNNSNDPSRALVSLGRWAIMLMTVPGTTAGTWRYVDPFDPAAPHMFRWSAENDDGSTAFPVTAYDIVEQEYLPKILNLRLDRITDAYKSIADSGRTLSLANHQVLGLIRAADSVEEREQSFLWAAQALNEWIIEQEGEMPVHLINRWQICYRMGELSMEQRDSIRALKRRIRRDETDLADETELSCALLLDEAQEVEYLAGQMAQERLIRVKTWPIWHLHRPNAGGRATE